MIELTCFMPNSIWIISNVKVGHMLKISFAVIDVALEFKCDFNIRIWVIWIWSLYICSVHINQIHCGHVKSVQTYIVKENFKFILRMTPASNHVFAFLKVPWKHVQVCWSAMDLLLPCHNHISVTFCCDKY